MDAAGLEKALRLVGGKWVAWELKNRELGRLLLRDGQREPPIPLSPVSTTSA